MIKGDGPVLSCEWCEHHGHGRMHAFCVADSENRPTMGNKTPDWCPLRSRSRAHVIEVSTRSTRFKTEEERDIETALENQRKLSAEKGKALGELSDAKQRIKELEKLVHELRNNQLLDH